MSGDTNQPAGFQRFPFAVFNGCMPKEGPKSIPAMLILDDNSQEVNFLGLIEKQLVSEIQGVFIDNSANAASLSVKCNATGHTIVCPANAQGIFPLFAPNPPIFTVGTSGNATVNLQFLNFPVQAYQWGGSNMTDFFSAALTADVAITDNVTQFNGPEVSVGNIGTWYVSSHITVESDDVPQTMKIILWDGTTIIDSGEVNVISGNIISTVGLSGIITSPQGPLRISVQATQFQPGDTTDIKFNASGNGKDSTISAFQLA